MSDNIPNTKQTRTKTTGRKKRLQAIKVPEEEVVAARVKSMNCMYSIMCEMNRRNARAKVGAFDLYSCNAAPYSPETSGKVIIIPLDPAQVERSRNNLCDALRADIAALDRKTVESYAHAPFMATTNRREY